MDLVGDDRDVALEADPRHPGELVAREDAADRVVGVAEDERARARVDRGAKGVEIGHVAAVPLAPERGAVAGEPVVGRGPEDRRVDRQLHQQAVAGRGERVTGHVEAGDHARDQHQGLRRDRPAVALLHAIDEDLGELRPLEAVAVHPVLDALPQRPHHRLGRGEVHVRHPERQDVGGILAPLVAVGGTALDDAVEVVGHGGHRGEALPLTLPSPQGERVCDVPLPEGERAG